MKLSLVWAVQKSNLTRFFDSAALPIGLIISFIAVGCTVYFEWQWTGIALLLNVGVSALIFSVYVWLEAWRSKHWRYRSACILAILRARSVQALAWVSGVAVMEYSRALILPTPEKWLLDSSLETLAEPLLYLLSGGLGLLLALTFQGLPRYLAIEVTCGRLPAHIACQILSYCSAWFGLDVLITFGLSVILALGSWFNGVTVSFNDFELLLLFRNFFLTGFAATSSFTLVLLGMASYIRHYGTASPDQSINPKNAIWLVFSQPITDKPTKQLIDRLARLCPDRTVTLVAPAGSDVAGEHLYLADQVGLLKALFPRREIEIRDWLRTVPYTSISNKPGSLELYPSASLIPFAVQTLRAEQDKTLLICQHGDDLEPWRDQLPSPATRVILTEESRNTPPDIAGYEVMNLAKSTALQQWLQDSPSTQKPVVFISYIKEYWPYTRLLTQALQPHCEVLSDLELKPGDNWNVALAEMLARADALIAIVGRASAGRELPLAEIERAISQDKRIIPIAIEPFSEPQVLWRYQFANPRRSEEDIAYLGLVAEHELNSVIREVAENILVGLGIVSFEKAAINQTVDVVKADPAKSADGFMKKYRNWLWVTLAGLLLVAAAYYFVANPCSSNDPPFECKFNQ